MRSTRNAAGSGRARYLGKLRKSGFYTSSDLCAATGATYRQVDYWVREGMLRTATAAEGSGSTRAFAPEEAIVARVLVRLSAGGVSGPILRSVPALIRGRGQPAQIDNWVVVVDPGRARLPPAPITLVIRTDLDVDLAAAE